METLGQRLKLVRGKLSQSAISTQLGIPQQTWNNYETGKSNPNLGFLDALCTKFKINTDWLLFGRGEMRSGDEGTAPPPFPPGAAFPPDVVFTVVEALEEFLQAQQGNLPPSVKAEVVRQLCQMLMDMDMETVRPGQMFRLIQGALSKAG